MSRGVRSAELEKLVAAAVAMTNYPTMIGDGGLWKPGADLPTIITPDMSVTLSRREYLSMQAAAVERDALRADLVTATEAHLAAGAMLASAHQSRAEIADDRDRLRAELDAARGIIAELSRRPTLENWRDLVRASAPAVTGPKGFPAKALRFSR